LAVTVLEEVQAAAEIRALDERITAATELDMSCLREAVTLFEKDAESELQLSVLGRDPIRLGDRVLKMKTRVAALESEKNPIGIGLGMSFLGMAMNAALAILHENHRPLRRSCPSFFARN
jgi:hypothetical protein